MSIIEIYAVFGQLKKTSGADSFYRALKLLDVKRTYTVAVYKLLVICCFLISSLTVQSQGTCVSDYDGNSDGQITILDLIGLLTAYGDTDVDADCIDDAVDECVCPEILGCTNSLACNYQNSATVDDGGCQYSENNDFELGSTMFLGVSNPQNGCPDGISLFDDNALQIASSEFGYNLISSLDDEEYIYSLLGLNQGGILINILSESKLSFCSNSLRIEGMIDIQIPWNGTAFESDLLFNVYFAPNTFESGCSDTLACNFSTCYPGDYGLCEYPVNYYDCYGNCISDEDFDGVCDELEVLGCTDYTACNFNTSATELDDSCVFPNFGYDCFGNCLDDIDGDGVCDFLEVFGCVDSVACNFVVYATEVADDCIYPEIGFDCDGAFVQYTWIESSEVFYGDSLFPDSDWPSIGQDVAISDNGLIIAFEGPAAKVYQRDFDEWIEVLEIGSENVGTHRGMYATLELSGLGDVIGRIRNNGASTNHFSGGGNYTQYPLDLYLLGNTSQYLEDTSVSFGSYSSEPWVFDLSADGSSPVRGGFLYDDINSYSVKSYLYNGNGFTPITVADQGAFRIEVSGDGGVVVVTDLNDVRIYRRTGIIPNFDYVLEQSFDVEGRIAISDDGNRIAIGQTALTNWDLLHYGVGSVEIYEFDEITGWSQIGQTLWGEQHFEHFGKYLALDSAGQTLAVGSWDYDGSGPNSGCMRTFRFNGDSLVQIGQTIVGLEAGNHMCPVELSASGDYMIVGEPGDYSAGSCVRVFSLEEVLD